MEHTSRATEGEDRRIGLGTRTLASGALIKEAIHALVERAVESGDIRPDLDPLDLLRALVGVSNVASGPDWAQSARRLIQILVICLSVLLSISTR
jgi:hypothetical protein